MTPRTILVHIDDTDLWRVRLEIARGLLGDEVANGHVMGLYGVVDQTERHPYTRQASGDFLAKVDAAEAPFRAACEALGLSCGWHGVHGADADLIGMQMASNLQTVDLSLVSQPRPEDAGHTLTNDVIEEMATTGGRPLLVLPYITRSFPQPKRIVVALNEDGASARALADSLPFMLAAESVTLLAISPDPVGQQWRWEAHRDTLARHGVTARIEHEIPGEIPVTELILSRCADLAADMLTLGAHGAYDPRHRRRGNVTKGILPSLTLPVLISR